MPGCCRRCAVRGVHVRAADRDVCRVQWNAPRMARWRWSGWRTRRGTPFTPSLWCSRTSTCPRCALSCLCTWAAEVSPSVTRRSSRLVTRARQRPVAGADERRASHQSRVRRGQVWSRASRRCVSRAAPPSRSSTPRSRDPPRVAAERPLPFRISCSRDVLSRVVRLLLAALGLSN
jgi:hypothetical protein